MSGESPRQPICDRIIPLPIYVYLRVNHWSESRFQRGRFWRWTHSRGATPTATIFLSAQSHTTFAVTADCKPPPSLRRWCHSSHAQWRCSCLAEIVWTSADSQIVIGGIVVASISACWLLPSRRVFQLSLESIRVPLPSRSSKVGSSNAFTPETDGPRARTSTRVVPPSVPPTSNQPTDQDIVIGLNKTAG